MESHLNDDGKHESRRQSKRRNKLSSKRTKSQKIGDGNNKEVYDVFSPVSCTLSRKNSRTDGEADVIIVSDDEDDENLKANRNLEKTKDKLVESKTNRSETNIINNKLSDDYIEQTILSDDHSRHFNEILEKTKQEYEASSSIKENDQLKTKRTDDECFETLSLNCSRPISYSSSEDTNFTCKVLTGTISDSERKLKIQNDEDFGNSCNDISNTPKKLNSPLSGCDIFSESIDTSISKREEVDLEQKIQRSENLETSYDPNHSAQKCVLPNLQSTSEEEVEQRGDQKEGEDTDSRIMNLSLEHLNDITPAIRQENSDIGCVVNSENNNTNEASLVHHSRDNSPKLVYSCPLCWKTFQTSQSHTLHMKECAANHNLNTLQLLDALKLQEKQFAERSALGLPDIPAARVIKKPIAKKKTGGGNDSNLQLALALSKSLQEAEVKEQLEEDECLIEAGLGHEVVERQKTMLERFGFTSSRTVLSSSTNSRPKQGKKNKNKSTVLTQRTKEERERLITEKVAIILIGEENNLSSPVSNEKDNHADHSMGVMNNLQKYEKKFNSLWNAVTSSCDEDQKHYVDDLSNLISPCKFKAGEKIKHLSQVPGRNVSPETEKAAANDDGLHDSTSSLVNAQLGKEAESLSTESKTRKSLQNFFAEKDPSNKNLAETLISDWRAILNKKTLSDVKIIVGSDLEIPGHRLVFYVRCRPILRDIIIEKGSEKSTCLLMWTDVSYRAALAFLQFIYCGLTSKILRLDEQDNLKVQELAERYRVEELVSHLKVMNKVRAKVNKQFSPSSSQFHRSVIPSKAFSLQNTYQNDGIIGFSQGISESSMPISEECIPHEKDKLSANFPPKYYSDKDNHTPMIPSQETCLFSNLDKSKDSSPSQFSTKSNSGHISDNDISSGKNFKIGRNHPQEMNIVNSPIPSNIETENNVNSPSSRQSTLRSASPDLFMDEKNEESTQGTSKKLSSESGMDIHYLLAMFDICLTPNNQQRISQQKTPMKSKTASPVGSQTKNSSPILNNKSLSSPSVEGSINNSQRLTLNQSQSSLEHVPKTNDSINENKIISSFSLDAHVEPETSEEILFKSDKNKSQSINKNFDCINFLENLISDSPYKSCNEDAGSGSKQTSLDSKRKYSERDSSNDSCRFDTKKVCREGLENKPIDMSSGKINSNQSELNCSKSGENNAIDTLDLTQSNDDIGNSLPCSLLNHEANNKSCSELVPTMPESGSDSVIESDNEVKYAKSGMTTIASNKETSDTDKQNQNDWDSFDEMCNAAEPEIFTQDLNKLLSSQSTSSKSDRHKDNSPFSPMSQKKISSSNFVTSPHRTKTQTSKQVSLEDTLIACLNESVLWKEENAPILKSSKKDRKSTLLQEHNKYYKTPTQPRNVDTDDVTPPANYSAMKTPELKKELNRFGLKPTLTKKQAKIMLRYIYDQLHPFITVSDSEDTTEGGDNGLPPSPFKIPDRNTQIPRSPTKKVNHLKASSNLARSKRSRQNPVSARRSLASQIDNGSDCDELSSQESSSSSTVDVAEEMFVEDLDLHGSQDVYSSDNLPSVVQHYIAENPDLHQKVLQHEPIWIEEFLKDLKSQNYKFKMNNLMDYFDEQCITFRTLQAQKSRQRKRERREAKKKKSPAKKKRKPSTNKSASSSTLNSPCSSSN